MSNAPHRWGLIETRFGTFAAWIDAEGRLTRLRLSARGAAAVEPRAVHDEDALEGLRRQIAEYCAGSRRTFDVERAAQGSAFQHCVWDALMRIPFGETASYGAVAKAIGCPAAARAVGRANAVNPIALVVPCHRVIGADGTLTGYAGGLPLKKALLAHEAECSARAGDLFAPAAVSLPA